MKSPEIVIAPIFCVGSTRMAELGHKHASWPSRIDENIGPLLRPPDTASTPPPTTLATSAAVWTGGRTMLTGRPFRTGAIRSRTNLAAGLRHVKTAVLGLPREKVGELIPYLRHNSSVFAPPPLLLQDADDLLFRAP